MLILGSCAAMQAVLGATTEAPADVNAVACGAFRPIIPSRRDTDETIIAIREHNAAYDALCGAR